MASLGPTVLISSRTGELGSSRRAAFRAVHDQRWVPLLYETEPSEFLITDRARSRTRSNIRSEKEMRNARRAMEKLLENADYFVGIYGTSLGDPMPVLSNLRPLEFEFLYFLMSKASPGKKPKLPISTNLRTCYHARIKLEGILRRLGDKSDKSAKSKKYRRIFQERMAMFLKMNRSDDPTSSLMYSTLLKISPIVKGGAVQRFTSSVDRPKDGYQLYRRPSSHLYKLVRDKIVSWEEKRVKAGKEADPRMQWISVISTQRVGTLLGVVKFVFDSGYNVSEIKMGLDDRKRRVVGLKVSPFRGADPDFHKALEKKYRRRVKYSEPELRDHKLKAPASRLRVIVADRPGMVVRILTALVLLGQNVLNVTIDSEDKAREFGLTEVKLREFDLTEVKLVFRQAARKCKFDLRAVMAELASSPGVYSVIPARSGASEPLVRPAVDIPRG